MRVAAAGRRSRARHTAEPARAGRPATPRALHAPADRRSPSRLGRALLGLLFCAPGLVCSACRPSAAAAEATLPSGAAAAPVRAAWVARFHYRSADDVREIIANCKALGLNTVLFQVRGEGTVAHHSTRETFLRAFDERDPGFDPLAIAVAAAHEHGLRVEAWVNVMPGWYGPTPPSDPRHIYHTHPEWFLHDQHGARQALNDHYVILNPCLAEVRRHITAVLEEIASQYEIDGLHLDYVRFAWDATPGAVRRFPRDAATLAAFQRDCPDRTSDDDTAWRDWRANQLTRLVAELRSMLRRVRPRAVLSAALWGNATAGYADYLQNGTGWLAAGLIDAAYPMAYRPRLPEFREDLRAYRAVGRGRVVPGVGVYKLESGEAFSAQLAACTDWGGDFALFSYESLYATFQDRLRKKPDRRLDEQRRERREALTRAAR